MILYYHGASAYSFPPDIKIFSIHINVCKYMMVANVFYCVLHIMRAPVFVNLISFSVFVAPRSSLLAKCWATLNRTT